MENINVLIVEDESLVALDLKNTLSKLNYNVLDIATSGAGAVVKAKELNPDIILMDIMLKGDMDGINACKEINSRLDIPIVYLTAYSDRDTLRRIEKTNYYSYILKPFDEKDLCIKLRMAVYSHKLNKDFNKKIELFYKVFNHINEPLLVLDKDNIIIFVNKFLLNLINYEEDYIIGKKINILINDFNEKNNFCNFLNKKFIQFFFSNENIKIILLKSILNQDFSNLENKVSKLAIDLNNIFTLVIGNVELCKMKADIQNYEFYELLKDTEEKLNRINLIKNNLMGFDNQYDEKEIINLKTFIFEKFFYINNIKFLENTYFNLKIDRLSLFKIINSVIKNSFESTRNNDSIYIEVSKDKSYIIINIYDTGIGIEEKNINRIFEPFFTTKNGHKGLGLTISKFLVKKYGGEILVKSIPNKETKFTIYLPEYK